ncbi:MAG: alpha/beta hydrolase [Oenococcus sp.]|uniref:alpha/beta fold hydrolase n=1 Tax=Oenococcus sp. TaxID=1979414 RepID=UPI0039E7D81C
MSFFYTNDHVKLDYHELGDPSGLPVILIEGYSGSEMTWVGQISDFTKAGFHVITYDRRNHGKSQSVPFGMRISRHAMDLAELIDHLQLKQKIVLIGHSMGASTIFAYLSLFGSQRLQAVVTEDQSPKAINDNSWQFGQYDSSWSNFLELVKQIRTTRFTRIPVDQQFKIALGKVYQPFDFDFNEPLLIDSLSQDWRDQIPLETEPHLFLAGEKSPLWPAGQAKAAAEMNPLAESYVFAGAGHIPHLELAPEFNRVVIDFINQHRPADSHLSDK